MLDVICVENVSNLELIYESTDTLHYWVSWPEVKGGDRTQTISIKCIVQISNTIYASYWLLDLSRYLMSKQKKTILGAKSKYS